MATETKEQKATNRALDAIYKYIKPGTNEGISFTVCRLTDDLFTTSFLGGGDASVFTASGKRGTISSQLSNGRILDSGGALPHEFPIQFKFNLNNGKATGNWNNPATGAAETVTVTLAFFKSVGPAGEKYYIFYGNRSSDGAGYTFTFELL
jgi:hypothetical protein